MFQIIRLGRSNIFHNHVKFEKYWQVSYKYGVGVEAYIKHVFISLTIFFRMMVKEERVGMTVSFFKSQRKLQGGWVKSYNCKACLKRSLKRKTKHLFSRPIIASCRLKYCKMLLESILQYFRPSLSYHLSLRPFVLSIFEWSLNTPIPQRLQIARIATNGIFIDSGDS